NRLLPARRNLAVRVAPIGGKRVIVFAQSFRDMEPRLLKLAEEIIAKSDREHPADTVLRAELKRQRNLGREDGREISRTVFTYFRWFGFLDLKKRVAENIFIAAQLAEKFSRN